MPDHEFWTTLPGILTGISGVLLAIGTLAATLVGLGLLDPSFFTGQKKTTTPITFPSSNDTKIQPLSCFAFPSTAQPGQEILIICSRPVTDAAIYYKERPISKKNNDSKSWIITLPDDATSGIIEILSLEEKTSINFLVIPPSSPMSQPDNTTSGTVKKLSPGVIPSQNVQGIIPSPTFTLPDNTTDESEQELTLAENLSINLSAIYPSPTVTYHPVASAPTRTTPSPTLFQSSVHVRAPSASG